MDRQIKIQDILSKLDNLEEIECDENLEEYLLKERQTLGFLPKLKLINGISLDVTDKAERGKINRCK